MDIIITYNHFFSYKVREEGSLGQACSHWQGVLNDSSFSCQQLKRQQNKYSYIRQAAL